MSGPRSNPPSPLPNKLRVIGGRWRGARIDFPPLAALRPTPDRVRETLFNWLQPVISGARCLDLFAGSGALGIEALSRGAQHVELVDSEPAVGRHLQQTLTRLGATQGVVQVSDALKYLDGPPRPFDVVFLDPPFASSLLQRACDKLGGAGWLAADAFVYVESPANEPLPQLPSGWVMHRAKRAGQVGYHLLRASRF
ncbi:MAG TPA: 16S rRNA (guanine(966)-N(2))-methyltransferase RsmD [Steroidobacteraceae bacterium]|jgi:16S rRNA (guanine966-N2)-methyltransferase